MRRKLIIAFTAASMWGGAFAAPLAAGDVTECYDEVIVWCADAMDDARWYERFALGLTCSAMLGGCVLDGAISISL